MHRDGRRRLGGALEQQSDLPLGVDGVTGLPIYAYDYKADVKKAKEDKAPMPPKRVGPMAQDMEKIMPGSTAEIGGKKVIMDTSGGPSWLMGAYPMGGRGKRSGGLL